ncbi:hypothetical protein Pta02_58010 [Planobispora takensis]|uniref:Uncharacterized protein n=1 Tax=Planobispora takensis TaxID=1367882 RepID=A0A8J3T130_9ACTN|nr:hypothetical protein Pta02_58010 [Planobispora takensis]
MGSRSWLESRYSVMVEAHPCLPGHVRAPLTERPGGSAVPSSGTRRGPGGTTARPTIPIDSYVTFYGTLSEFIGQSSSGGKRKGSRSGGRAHTPGRRTTAAASQYMEMCGWS